MCFSYVSHAGCLWDLPGRAGAPVNCSPSAIDPSHYFWILHIMRTEAVLATARRYCAALASVHVLVAFGCGLLAFSYVIFTSYVSCPVLHALPAVTKVDG